MTRRALILLDGEKPTRDTLMEFWDKMDFTVCADGAAATCLEYHLMPNLIVGDLDSFDKTTEAQFHSTEILKLADQETTDSEKAIQYCIDKGYSKLLLFGALGKRLDHSLYNLGLLRMYFEHIDEILIVSDDEIALLITGEKHFAASPGTRISLIPVFGRVESVTAKGLEYPIKNKTLELGIHSSVSNTFGTKNISVISSTYLLAVFERHSELAI